MLEGRAASLESCQFQRALPTTRNLAKTRRRLHTEFWRHGAAEVELFNACQSVLHSPLPDMSSFLRTPNATPDREEGEGGRPDTLAVSSFVLDFLYPNAAVSFLRRFVPGGPLERNEWQARRRYLGGLPRSYFSSAREESTGLFQRGASFIEAHGGRQDADQTVTQIRDNPREEEEEGAVLSNPEALREALATEHAGMYDRIWQLYSNLEPKLQDDFRTEVLIHLARSSRPVEAWRICELFSLYDIADWTLELVDAGIKACLILSDVARARSIFQQSLDRYGMVQGLDALLAYGFRNSTWDLVIQAWEVFSNWQEKNSEPATSEPASAPRVTATPELNEVSSIPDFARKVSQLYAALDRHFDTARAAYLRDNLDSLLRFLVHEALALFQPKDAAFILECAQDPIAYENFMRLCMERGDKSLAVSMYRKYRLLPDVRIRIFVLRWMLSIFYPHDIRGMEQVRKDWSGRYESMSRNAYQKYIAFYAGRGDVKSASHMWAEYKKYFPEGPHSASDDPSPMVNIMHAHAVRGDIDKAKRVFGEFMDQPGRQATSMQWNILLNAHVKAVDYDGAIETFETICERGLADRYSFGTLMGMAGSRGDLQFTLDLYNMALDMNIQPDISMTDALLEAYCQNDRFAEAERLCVRMTKQRKLEGNYATLWNTLLYHAGRRRDLAAVNRFLEAMVEHEVAYDSETYDHLLNSLVYCRQPHHALNLIAVAEKEKVFQPTQRHYLLLMAAFIGSREPHMALRVNEMMDEAHFPVSSERITNVIKALGKWQDLPASERKERDGRFYLAQALSVFRSSLGKYNETTPAGASSVAQQYSQIVFFLIQLRDFVTVREVMDLYANQFPTRSNVETMPINLLTNLMLADFYEKKFDSVKKTWELILERRIRIGRPRGTSQHNRNSSSSSSKELISPAYRFSLHDPLITMQRLYLAEEDADALIALIARVTAEGFQLDSKNWNYHVQALARLKRWKEAFSVCEEKLMPQWSGWFRVRGRGNEKNQLPLQLRRLGSSPRYLRPISHTILILAREYLYLEQMAPWSTDAARIFKSITNDCIRVVKAITTMVRSDSELEREVFHGAAPGRSGFREDDTTGSWEGESGWAAEPIDGGELEVSESMEIAASSRVNNQQGADSIENESQFLEKEGQDKQPDSPTTEHQVLRNDTISRHATSTRLALGDEIDRKEELDTSSNVPYDDVWVQVFGDAAIEDDGGFLAGAQVRGGTRRRGKGKRRAKAI